MWLVMKKQKPSIALVGQPNSGKSTVFNVLSDIKAYSSNFSGTSVEYTESDINIKGQTFHIIDLPGIYSLNFGDEAEKLTFEYLINRDIDLIINVVDASLLARSLELMVELLEFGIPMVIALNMWDEADRKGIKIYPERLEKALHLPVVTTSARYGKGVRNLIDTCHEVITSGNCMPGPRLEYTSHIEQNVHKLEERMAEYEIGINGTPRFYAIKAIENPELVPEGILALLAGDLDEIRTQITSLHNKDSYETISYERHHIAMKLAEDISHFVDRKTVPLREKLDRYWLHPILGFFPLLIFFLLFFGSVYFIGYLLSEIINAPLDRLPPLYKGIKTTSPFWWFIIDGVVKGVAGALGIVLPYFLPLVFLTSISEDTGYMARIAFLMDGIMHKLGLHGKSVIPFILGFGCSVPALYGTRIIDNRRERIATALLIPFVPCSARTTVIFALAIAFTGPLWALFVYAFAALVTAGTGRLLSLFMGKPTGLILEIPDLKIPSLRVSFRKSWQQVKEFLKFALPFLIVGSAAMGWLEYSKINDSVNRILAPLLQGLLGLPEALGSTLVFGFFRKELIIVMANSALGVQSISQLPLTPQQVIVFLIFVTLYFPCFATFLVMWKEFKWRLVLLATVLSVCVATLAAYVVRVIL